MQNLDARLQPLFQAVFDLPPGTDIPAVRQEQVAAWDSMAHISLVAALESEFNIAIDAGDSMLLTSYRATREYLEGLNG